MQWTTRDALMPTVQYGTASGQYTTNVTGLTHTYNASTLCGHPANDTGYVAPGTFNNATIITKPSTRYFYVSPCWPALGPMLCEMLRATGSSAQPSLGLAVGSSTAKIVSPAAADCTFTTWSPADLFGYQGACQLLA